MVHLFCKTGNSLLMPLIQVPIHTFISTRAKTGSTNSPMVSKQLMFLVTYIYVGLRFKFLNANCPLQISVLSKIILRIQTFVILKVSTTIKKYFRVTVGSRFHLKELLLQILCIFTKVFMDYIKFCFSFSPEKKTNM